MVQAGLCPGDRRVVENLFTQNCLVVLACTSTLALGVNLPAHLVVIKSTQQMNKVMILIKLQSFQNPNVLISAFPEVFILDPHHFYLKGAVQWTQILFSNPFICTIWFLIFQTSAILKVTLFIVWNIKGLRHCRLQCFRGLKICIGDHSLNKLFMKICQMFFLHFFGAFCIKEYDSMADKFLFFLVYINLVIEHYR